MAQLQHLRNLVSREKDKKTKRDLFVQDRCEDALYAEGDLRDRDYLGFWIFLEPRGDVFLHLG